MFVMDEFYKTPTTPHLAVLGSADIRDDKVMDASERENFLQHELIIEEKVDGACLGISFDGHGNLQAQNRGAYLSLSAQGQWRALSDWLDMHADLLFEALSERYILFGEWCYAKHSVFYEHLPDWFIGFDIFDKQSMRFLSCARRDVFLRELDLTIVPCLGRGRYSFTELQGFFGQSRFGEATMEGIYLRHDEQDWLVKRAKLVNPHFTQAIGEHWSRGKLQVNRLQSMVGAELRV